MKKIIALCCVVGLFSSSVALASDATDALFKKYKAEGVTKVDAEKGKKDWTKKEWNSKSKAAPAEVLSCSSCHKTDLTAVGEHHKTHKEIKPMSTKVNAERFTDEKKIEKWFKRNCMDTRGQECTAQEKADFLAFFLAQ